MRRRRLCALSICRSLFLVFISVSFISTASATLITSGTAFITGNDPNHSTGSFKVKVDFAAYDGTSSTDPLGITTSNAQLTFVLTHLGGDGIETPVLKFGRFAVFAPDIFSTTQFYTASAVQGTTGRAPRTTKLYPPSTPVTPNHADFLFDNGLAGGYLPQFISGEVSKLLVLKTPSSNLPARILLEIDNSGPGTTVDGDVQISIPEPCSLAIFGTVLLLAIRRRAAK